MTLPVIVIRPEPGNASTRAAARAMGLEALGFPLFAIAPTPWTAPPPAKIDALLISSANALRHAGEAITPLLGKPAYAVGNATAGICRAAGLTIAGIGRGDLQATLDLLAPTHRRLLRLAGRERMEITPPPGVTIVERVVYASEPKPMPGPLALLLLARALPGAVVMLHSAEAARHFATECAVNGIPKSRLRLAALAPRVADAAGEGWELKASPPRPDDRALLALAAQLCQ